MAYIGATSGKGLTDRFTVTGRKKIADENRASGGLARLLPWLFGGAVVVGGALVVLSKKKPAAERSAA